LHLYTGLFLVPWMMIYAVSAFCLNHVEWFEKKLELRPTPKLVQETDFVPNESFPSEPKEQARAILKHLELDGPHFIQGQPTPSQMRIFRYCGAGHYQVTWQREQARLVVTQQKPFSFYSFVNAMHFQRGYGPYFASLTWAIIVDVVTISTVTWVITGIYLWARRPRKRLLGGVCLVAGSLVFAGLAILLCL
jgi:hypothetical protein